MNRVSGIVLSITCVFVFSSRAFAGEAYKYPYKVHGSPKQVPAQAKPAAAPVVRYSQVSKPSEAVEPQRSIASSRRPASGTKVKRKIASLPSQVKTETSARDIRVDGDQSGTAMAVFLGAGAGLISVKSSNPASDPNSSGSGLLGRAAFTLYNPKLALELGVGWLQSRVKGSSIIATNSGSRTIESDVLTRAGIIEFSPRFRLAQNRFEIGPSAGVMFGTNASFGGPQGSFNTPVLVGGKLAYVVDGKQTLFRVVGQGTTSLTIPDRQVMIASIGFEIGLPLTRGKTVIRERETHTIRDNYKQETVEKETVLVHEVNVVKELVLFSFDDQIVHFEFNRAELSEDSRKFISALGRYLADNPALWGHLKVEGHTDSRGTDEYNQNLSEARIASVRQILIDAGVPAEKLDSKGYGKSRPIDEGASEVSMARNRRVEMSFSDVTDTRQLRDEINRMRFALVRPETCRGEHCR